MTEIPLILKLRKRAHKDVASAQDIIVRELYKVFDDAVFHGGTSIWRCYAGDRFSEDIDVYIPRDEKRLNLLFHNFEKSGFKIKKRKSSDNALYSNLELSGVSVRFEALFRKIDGSLGDYTTVDGNVITVYTLTPEEIVKEKVDAYLNRQNIRDLYDIFFLLKHVRDTSLISDNLSRLIKDFKPPLDEQDLRVLIITGIVPRADKMLEYIKRWAK